jgi:hypothetical protein
MEMSFKVYHYTTYDAYNTILDNPENWLQKMVQFFRGHNPQKLNPSLEKNNPNDVRAGEGWYFTDIEPGSMPRKKIAKKLWGSRGADNRINSTEYFLRFKFHGNTTMNEFRKHAFIVPIISTAKQEIIEHGQVPDI